MANRDRDRDEEFRGGAEEPGGRRPLGYGSERYQYRSPEFPYPSPEFRGDSYPNRSRSQEFSPSSYGRGFEGRDRESGWSGSTGGYGRSPSTSGGAGYEGGRGQEFGGGYSGVGPTYGYSEGRFGTGSRTRGRYTGRGPKNYVRSDDRIREDVSDRLEQHGEIDASELEVRVENGEVTLDGTVEDRHMKRLAEDAVEECSGVRQVHNRIRVQANGGEHRQILGGQAASGQQNTSSKAGSTATRPSNRT